MTNAPPIDWLRMSGSLLLVIALLLGMLWMLKRLKADWMMRRTKES